MTVRIAAGSGDDAFARVTARVQAVAEAAALEIVAAGEREVVEVMSTGQDPRGFVGRVDTGQARQAVQIGPVAWNGRAAVARLAPSGPATDYWPVIEAGRRPGKPISAVGKARIGTWARRKGVLRRIVDSLAAQDQVDGAAVHGPAKPRRRLKKGEREQLEEQALFLLTRAIRRRGTPGLHPFRAAATKLRSGLARAILERVAARARGRR